MRGLQAVRPWAARLRALATLLLTAGGSLLAGTAADAASGPPVNVAPPSISGTPKDEQRLKASKGTWTGQTPITYAFRWSRCDASGENCATIASAVKALYRATHADVGHTLRVAVTATNEAGAATAGSDPSGVVAPSAPAKKALPKISGLKEDGQLLTASNGVWKGTPPLSFAYRWEACDSLGENCSVIPGATSSTYRPVTPQIGGKLRVIVTASNDVGAAGATSRASSKIKPGPPVDTASPAVSGSLQEGQTLTANPGSWAGTGPFSFGYQWLRCSISGGSCEEIPGATAPTYTASGEDLAHNLAVVVIASNSLGTASATSAETQAILGILPTNTLLPSISGLLEDGQPLSVANGTWTGSEPISYSYQWQLCNTAGASCSNIAEAVDSTFKLSSVNVGSTLRLIVTATNSAGSTSATSAPTGLIAALLPSNTALPTISGLLKVGQLLSATTGSWSGTTPMTFGYQWQLCNLLGSGCANILNATSSTFLLGALDVGGTLRVVGTATNAAGSTPASSAASGLISSL